MIRHILAKPFEWLMRLFYGIHLAIDNKSEWYCVNEDTMNFLVTEFVDFDLTDNEPIHAFDDYDDDDNCDHCECDCI